MALSAIQLVQKYIDEGRIDYNLLNADSKRIFSPPPTAEERRAKADAAAFDQATIGRKTHQILNGVDPALAQVPKTGYGEPILKQGGQISEDMSLSRKIGNFLGSGGLGLTRGAAGIMPSVADVVMAPVDLVNTKLLKIPGWEPGHRAKNVEESWNADPMIKKAMDYLDTKESTANQFAYKGAEIIPSIIAGNKAMAAMKLGKVGGLIGESTNVLKELEAGAAGARGALKVGDEAAGGLIGEGNAITGAAARVGSKALGAAAEQAIKDTPEILTSWYMTEYPKKPEDRTPLGEYALMWTGGNLAFKMGAKGLGAVKGKAGEMIGKLKGSSLGKAADEFDDADFGAAVEEAGMFPDEAGGQTIDTQIFHVDPYGNANTRPGEIPALPEGRPGDRRVDLNGEPGNIEYPPREDVLAEQGYLRSDTTASTLGVEKPNFKLVGEPKTVVEPQLPEEQLQLPGGEQPKSLPEGQGFNLVGEPWDSRYPQPKTFSQLQSELAPIINAMENPNAPTSSKAMIDYLFDAYKGTVSKAKIGKMTQEQLVAETKRLAQQNKPLWDMMKEEAKKRGYDLETMLDVEANPALAAERARLAEVAGVPPEAVNHRINAAGARTGENSFLDQAWDAVTKPFQKYGTVVQDESGAYFFEGKNGHRIQLDISYDPKDYSNWQPYANKIVLRYDTRVSEFEFDHELTHAMRDLGMINDKEWQTLLRLASKEVNPSQIKAEYLNYGRQLQGDDLAHEVIARAVQQWRQNGIPGEAKGIVEKILQFVRDIGRELGITEGKATDVVRDVMAGKPLMRKVETEYPKGTKATKILSDIRNYYQNGTEPTISEISRFRYAIPGGRDSRINQIRDMVVAGAEKIPQASDFDSWSAEMLQQFPGVAETMLQKVFDHAQNVRKGGTTIKYNGETLQVNASDIAEGARAGIAERVGLRKPILQPTIPPGQKERGVAANIRTDYNRPEELRDSMAARTETYDPLANTETLQKAQAIFGDGSPEALESAVSQLGTLLDQYKPEAAPLVKLIADKLVEQGNLPRARELLATAAERATEAGQFGQAFRILRNSDPATFLMMMDKQLKKLNAEGLAKYKDDWRTVNLTQEEVDLIASLPKGDSKGFSDAMEQIQSRIADELPADVWEKINAWRHIAMLLNVKTQVRNVFGNVFMQGMRRSSKQISAALQNVLLKAEDRTQVWNIDSEYQKLAEDYFEANKKDLLAGPNKYNEELRLGGLERDKRVFETNALEQARKFTYNLLEWGDIPFYKMTYINRLASYAQAKGIKDFRQLPQDAFNTAKREAEEATYKDASKLASYLNKVKHPGPEAGPGSKLIAWGTEAAMPFTKTPINIIKRGVQYSPYGILKGIGQWRDPATAAAGIDEMAKGLTGTAILGLGYLGAKYGILTGKTAKDPDLREWNTSTGVTPFSIKGVYSYDWMQPFAVPLSIGVEIYNALKGDPKKAAKMESVVLKGDSRKLFEIATAVSGAIYDSAAAYGDTVLNMSVMKGVKNLLGNPQGWTAGMAELPGDYANQFVPTAFGQVAGLVDPTVRQSTVKGNIPATVASQMMAKTPGVSTMLEAKQTPFGQDVKRNSNVAIRAFAQLFSPGIIPSDQKVSPMIDKELRRLNESGLTKQFPTMVPNYIDGTQKHPRIELTPKEHTQYQKRVGQLTLAEFYKIIGSTEYRNAKADPTKRKSADDVKADILAAAIEDSKAIAKEEILKRRGYTTK